MFGDDLWYGDWFVVEFVDYCDFVCLVCWCVFCFFFWIFGDLYWDEVCDFEWFVGVFCDFDFWLFCDDIDVFFYYGDFCCYGVGWCVVVFVVIFC